MDKSEKVIKILDSFLFKEEIKNAYDLAMNELMEVSEEELETYNTSDICNVIGLYVA